MNIDHELGSRLTYGLKKDEPMSKHTSWMVGGPADYFLQPADLDELITIVSYSDRHKLPLYVLGNGTNLLVLDGGIRGLVIHIGSAFNYLKSDQYSLTAGAGISMTGLAKSAAAAGLTGLEFAIGIPGSLGGALIMNAGAFGGYIGEKVRLVKVVNYFGQVITLPRKEIHFGYRDSNLTGKGIIFEATLALEQAEQAIIAKKMEELSAERRKRHPKLPSAGSVFRNLPGKPAGKIIEEAGAKGLRTGGAEVSTEHANFIVNNGDATASDILNLIKTVRQLVKDKFNLELHPEVRIIGEEI